MSDWRLQGQEKYLKGASLRWATYQAPSEDWDHDHCEFCSDKFAAQDGDITEGYITQDARWICKKCFEDFQPTFDWSVS